MVMKYIKALFLIVFAVLSLSAHGQSKVDVVNEVRETIKAGSAKELAKYLYQTVDINLEGKQESYSKAQAEFVLRDFFKAHVPNDFTIIHKGSSKSGQPFAIGQYKSGSDNYRVFMKIKTVNDEQLIHEISFSKE
jgi:hypothetical protein